MTTFAPHEILDSEKETLLALAASFVTPHLSRFVSNLFVK
jgi:hypothetical protein